jgi:hypothetical protein
MKRWVVQAIDQGVIEGAMDNASVGSGSIEGVMGGASDGSRSNRWSDGRCKLLIREQ